MSNHTNRQEERILLPMPVLDTNVEDLMLLINQNLFGGVENMEAKLKAYLDGDTSVIQ